MGYTRRHYGSTSEPALYQDIREVETIIVNRDRGACLTASDLPNILRTLISMPLTLFCSPNPALYKF